MTNSLLTYFTYKSSNKKYLINAFIIYFFLTQKSLSKNNYSQNQMKIFPLNITKSHNLLSTKNNTRYFENK